MSRAAVTNPDRRRKLREVPISQEVAQLLEPGSRAFRFGGCRVIVSQQRAGWHLSISRPDRLPSWEEVTTAAALHVQVLALLGVEREPGVRKAVRPARVVVRDARYALVPDEATMAMLLPPQSEYVNVHEFCLHLYEIPGEYIAAHQDSSSPRLRDRTSRTRLRHRGVWWSCEPGADVCVSCGESPALTSKLTAEMKGAK